MSNNEKHELDLDSLALTPLNETQTSEDNDNIAMEVMLQE